LKDRCFSRANGYTEPIHLKELGCRGDVTQIAPSLERFSTSIFRTAQFSSVGGVQKSVRPFFSQPRYTPPVVFTLRSISPASARAGRRLSGHRKRGWREALSYERHILTPASALCHPTTGRVRMAWHYWSRAVKIPIPDPEDLERLHQSQHDFWPWNLLHLVRIMKDAGGIPAHGNQRSACDSGCRFDCPNPNYR
jgi:hypothetical protein